MQRLLVRIPLSSLNEKMGPKSRKNTKKIVPAEEEREDPVEDPEEADAGGSKRKSRGSSGLGFIGERTQDEGSDTDDDQPVTTKMLKRSMASMFDRMEEGFQEALDKATSSLEARTDAIMKRERATTSREIMKSIDAELEASKLQEQTEWRTPTNKDQYEDQKKQHKKWQRTVRLAEAIEETEENKEIRAAAIKEAKEGEELSLKRIQLIRFADRETWNTALGYKGGNIALNEKEEKAMKQAVKDEERRSARRKDSTGSTSRRNKTRSPNRPSYNRSSAGGNSGTSRGNRQYSRVPMSEKICFGCRKMGHIMDDCPNKSWWM